MASIIMVGKDDDLLSKVQEHAFDFEADIPNADTIKSIDDIRLGRNVSRAFSSVKELIEDLNT